MAGVDPAKLPLAFKVLLASFATEREGKLYLDYPLLAQVLQTCTPNTCPCTPVNTQRVAHARVVIRCTHEKWAFEACTCCWVPVNF